jgi:DNA phosphorothioation-dependent restriction protein DptH
LSATIGPIPGDEKESPLRLVLDRSANTRDQARLEVRWTTDPDTIPKGSVEYRITILAGDEELAFQSVVHKEKSPQKVVFKAEDFEDFEDRAKFEAVVRIEAIGSDAVSPAESEGFVLELGSTEERVSLASGQIVRAIVEGVISRTTLEEFEEAAEKAHLAPQATQDKKGISAGDSAATAACASSGRRSFEWLRSRSSHKRGARALASACAFRRYAQRGLAIHPLRER